MRDIIFYILIVVFILEIAFAVIEWPFFKFVTGL